MLDLAAREKRRDVEAEAGHFIVRKRMADDRLLLRLHVEHETAAVGEIVTSRR